MPTNDGRASLRDIFAAARCPGLSPPEVALWVLYRSYEGPGGAGAFPGDDRLAEHMGLSQRSVQEYRARLLDKGYLRRKLRGPRPALFWAVTPSEASQPTANQEAESIEADCEATARSIEADCEAKPEASQPTATQLDDSQEASQKASQPAAPEYGEYGESNITDALHEGAEGASPPSEWPSPDEAVAHGYPDAFEALWSTYPSRAGSNPKKAAYRTWLAQVRNGATPKELQEGVERYAAYCEAEDRAGTEFVMMARTFLGPDERWREPWESERASSKPHFLRNRL